MPKVKRVFLGRGLPGCGKSTKIVKMAADCLAQGQSSVICSTDHFFVCGCCKAYNFDLTKLGHAHSWCQAKFRKALADGVENVFVDNTNVSANECKPYVEMGLDAGYDIHFVEPSTPWAFDLDELFKLNVHGVPMEALVRMKARWVPDMTVEKALVVRQPGDMHEDEKAAKKGVA